MEDLQVSDAEQIDLLVKLLGTESSSHAVSIRSSNAGNPKRGLQRLWERLNERYVYGSPEMVDASLKTKLANFPKMSNKDTKRLYELQYILSESSHLSVMRTQVLPSGRPSILQPCENEFKVKEQLSRNGEIGVPCKPAHTMEFNVFERTNNDDKPGMSHEDKQF